MSKRKPKTQFLIGLAKQVHPKKCTAPGTQEVRRTPNQFFDPWVKMEQPPKGFGQVRPVSNLTRPSFWTHGCVSKWKTPALVLNPSEKRPPKKTQSHIRTHSQPNSCEVCFFCWARARASCRSCNSWRARAWSVQLLDRQ